MHLMNIIWISSIDKRSRLLTINLEWPSDRFYCQAPVNFLDGVTGATTSIMNLRLYLRFLMVKESNLSCKAPATVYVRDRIGGVLYWATEPK